MVGGLGRVAEEPGASFLVGRFLRDTASNSATHIVLKYVTELWLAQFYTTVLDVFL